MSENRSDVGRPDTSRSDTALSLGERLRSARKARALSLEQVGHLLHLEDRVVVALEEERFREVGAPVFIRGHLRSYARLLDLPEEQVLEAYKSADPASQAPQKIARDLEEPLRSPPGPWAVAVVVVILLLGAVLTYVIKDDKVAPTTSTVTPEGVSTEMDAPVVIDVSPAAGGGTTATALPSAPAPAATNSLPASVPPDTPVASPAASDAPATTDGTVNQPASGAAAATE